MYTEIQYKTFDDLLDSVKIDLRTLDLEGLIDPQQLIKVAMKVNYELGLKVNPSRGKAIEIHKGKGKLPEDFYVLNFALLCEGHNVEQHAHHHVKTYTEGLLEGATIGQQSALFGQGNLVHQQTVVQTINPGVNNVSHNLNNTNVLVQIIGPDNTILSFNVVTPNNGLVQIISEAPVPIVDCKIILMASRPAFSGVTGSAEIVQDNDGKSVLAYNTNGRRDRYKVLVPMRIEKSKSVSADCLNLNSHAWHAAVIKNGFLVTNFDEGVVYINYQSMMEDDDGNLLVMDHPMVNEYYEYALKQRIFENLYINDENTANKMQLVEQRIRPARNNALSFINTPDFNELRKMWEANRKAQYHLYYNMFKR